MKVVGVSNYLMKLYDLLNFIIWRFRTY